MRIALFTDTYTPEINGVATSVHTLFQELTALGHEVHVFAPRVKACAKEPRVHRIASMPLIFQKKRRSVVFSPRLLARINRYHFDIVHTHSEYLVGMLGRVVAKMQRCCCVHTYHTIWEDYTYYVTHGIGEARMRRLAAKLSRIWCNHCDHVLVPTQKIHALLLQYGVRTPMSIIPSGLNLTRFAPGYCSTDIVKARRKECGLLPHQRALLNIGRIAKEKNLECIVQAMPPIFAVHPEVVLVIIGEGPWVSVLEKIAGQLGIASRVLFPGPKPWKNIHEYYQVGEVFVSASNSETQGLTYIEAMSSGLAVVAKSDPCLAGVIENGRNGLLFDSVADLQGALLRALSPDGRRLGAAAAQSVTQFSQDTFARKVAQTYRQTLWRMTGEEKWRP